MRIRHLLRLLTLAASFVLLAAGGAAAQSLDDCVGDSGYLQDYASRHADVANIDDAFGPEYFQAWEEVALCVQRHLAEREQALEDPVWVVNAFGVPKIIEGGEFERLARLIGEWSSSPFYSASAIYELPDVDRAIIGAFGMEALAAAAKDPDAMAKLRAEARKKRGGYLGKLETVLEQLQGHFFDRLAARDAEATTDLASELPGDVGIEGKPSRENSCATNYPGELYDAIRFTIDDSSGANCPAPYITTGWNRDHSPSLRTCAYCGAGYEGGLKWGCCEVRLSPSRSGN